MTDTIQNRTFTINIECDSAAFDGDACGTELARMLRGLADSLEVYTVQTHYLRDINGNHCGNAEMITETYSR
jgi:hypothetical protein